MPKINKTRFGFDNQKKQKLVKSVAPLQKKYFIIFMIWKISFLSIPILYKGLRTTLGKLSRYWTPLRVRRLNRIQGRFIQTSDTLKSPRIAAILICSFIGGVQIFKSYMGVSVFGLFSSNVLVQKTQMENRNWKTFYVADAPYLLKRRPVTYLYKKLDLLNKDRPLLLTLTPYAQNRANQLHFGFIVFKNTNTENSNKSYNIFNENKYPIYLPQSNSNVFDAIPTKMEATTAPLDTTFSDASSDPFSFLDSPSDPSEALSDPSEVVLDPSDAFLDLSDTPSILFEESEKIYQLNLAPSLKKNNNILKNNHALKRSKYLKRSNKKSNISIKQVLTNRPFTKKLLFKNLSRLKRNNLSKTPYFIKETQSFLRSLFYIETHPRILNPEAFTPEFEKEQFLKAQERILKSRLASFRVNFEEGYIKDNQLREPLFLTDTLKARLENLPNSAVVKEKMKKELKNIFKKVYIEAFKEECKKISIKSPPLYSSLFSKIKKNLKERPANPSYFYKLLDETKLSYYNTYLRPRLCSGYNYPDVERIRTQLFVATKPKQIQSFLPAQYRTLLTRRLLRVFKNRDLIVYPTAQQFGLNMPRCRKDHKIFTAYKTKNFMGFGQPDTVKMILTGKGSRIKNRQFFEVFEELGPSSWLMVSKAGFYFVGFTILQYLYQKNGKEIVVALIDLVCLIGVIDDGEFLKEELHLENKEKNYRAVRKVDKGYRQIVGMTSAIAGLSDSLWYLRTRNDFFANILSILQEEDRLVSELEPVLLVGPPGTGKTVLVQAFAGEAGVPVLLQSGGVLKDFKQRGKGAKSIRALFNRARRIAPCVVFIDEVDSIGARRQGMSLNTQGWRDTVEKLTDLEQAPASLDDLRNFFPESEYMDIDELDAKLEQAEEVRFGETLIDAKERREKRIEVLQEIELKNIKHNEQLGMLTQLLIELDGLNPINDILVFGATNRPFILDPALVRSGRFARVCKLRLPNPEKRIELLKLYTGLMGKINIKDSDFSSWAYLAQRVEGFTAADIATIVNESALITGTRDRTHTVKSIEAGIERTISYRPIVNLRVYNRELRKTILAARHRWFINNFFMKRYKLNKKKSLKIKKPPIFTNRDQVKQFTFTTEWKKVAYYDAGQAIVHILLPNHPSSVYFALQKRIKNFRYGPMHGLVLNFMDHLRYRSDLEGRLIGLMAGKASEFLSTSASIQEKVKNTKISVPGNLTDIGWSEMTGANLLSFIMVDKWYLYGHLVCIFQHHPLLRALNVYEYQPDEVTFFDAIVEEKEVEIREKNRLIAGGQRKSYPTWWVKQIMEEEAFFDRIFMQWYRIYLPEPEEDERNIEWCPPDEHYTAVDIKGVLSILYWEKVLTLMYDHLHHSLLLNSLNAGYSLLNKHRELLDYLVDFVLRHEKVRNPQIKKLTKPFFKNVEIFKNEMFGFKNLNDDDDKVTLSRNWGDFSRRKYSRTLSLEQIKECSIAKNQPDQEMIDLFNRLELDDSFLKYLSGFAPD